MDKQLLINNLKSSPQILKDLIATIPGNRLSMQFGDGIWSIPQHLNHLVLCQVMYLKRMELFTKEDKPEIVLFIPQDEDNTRDFKPVDTLVNGFVKWREKQLALIENADDDLWYKQGDHPSYTKYTFETMVRSVLIHDYFHYYRITELGLHKKETIKKM